MTQTATTQAVSFSHKRALHAGFASFVGTSIEFYDFYVYATAAAIVFPKLFFPEVSPLLGVMAAFATYAVGFFVRPLGGILFGYIGDKHGRRLSLVLTLILMGVSTALVGVLPTYATMGVWASVLLLLLRVAQGLAVGGEWGGAVLMAVENAPEKYKAFYGAFPQLGNPMGALLATGIFALMTINGNDFMMAWGWRIPFLLSVVLIGIGFWVRYTVEETPVFEQRQAELEADPKKEEESLWIAVRGNWKTILIAIGLIPISTGGYYVVTTFATSYATGDIANIHMDVNLFLNVLTVAALFELVSTLPIGVLADRWGRKRVMSASLLCFFAISIPMFLTLGTAPVWTIFVIFAATRVIMNGTWAPLASILSQMFGPDSRQTSLSVSYSIGVAIWGGLAPIVATALYGAFDSIWAVIFMIGVMVLLSLICLALAPQLEDHAFAQDSAPSGVVGAAAGLAT